MADSDDALAEEVDEVLAPIRVANGGVRRAHLSSSPVLADEKVVFTLTAEQLEKQIRSHLLEHRSVRRDLESAQVIALPDLLSAYIFHKQSVALKNSGLTLLSLLQVHDLNGSGFLSFAAFARALRAGAGLTNIDDLLPTLFCASDPSRYDGEAGLLDLAQFECWSRPEGFVPAPLAEADHGGSNQLSAHNQLQLRARVRNAAAFAGVRWRRVFAEVRKHSTNADSTAAGLTVSEFARGTRRFGPLDEAALPDSLLRLAFRSAASRTLGSGSARAGTTLEHARSEKNNHRKSGSREAGGGEQRLPVDAWLAWLDPVTHCAALRGYLLWC